MTPEQLKASILQYAIQGKLVEQRPEEGTGEELYQQMQTDKQTLIREKKIKKEKPLPDIIDDEIPFDVPESWKWVKVGNVGSWSSGATPSRTNPAYYGGSIPWLKTGDLNDGFIQEVPEYITDLALEKTSLRLNPIGSVLMAMYGATIGKLGILEIPVTTNQACCACIPYAGMNNKYLFYYLMSMRQSYIGMAEGGAQPNISKEKIVNSLIPLPPAEEQRRIVAKIEELLPYVDSYAAAYEKLEQFNAKFPEDMKKSILQYAIQGKLVEQRAEEGTGEELYQQIQAEKQRLIAEKKIKKEKPLHEIAEDEVPFDIPESWKWVRLSTIGITQTGNTPSKSHPEYIGIDIPFITPGDILNGQICYSNQALSLLGKEVARVCCAGSIMQVCIGGSIGKAAITYREVAFNQQINVVSPIACLSEYLFAVMQSAYFTTSMKERAGGTATPIINRGLWDSLLIPLPPLAEQRRIVAKLEEILPLCERLK
ncbi:MAG: restriction endonuclease subunit S [Eubacteriales bacterium]|nr:restriction endonuclease subunit S [Eubacteriales bacterium]